MMYLKVTPNMNISKSSGPANIFSDLQYLKMKKFVNSLINIDRLLVIFFFG